MLIGVIITDLTNRVFNRGFPHHGVNDFCACHIRNRRARDACRGSNIAQLSSLLLVEQGEIISCHGCRFSLLSLLARLIASSIKC
ncbi:hypothetical protein CDES_14575 (plasmid) [Corynebacterium deserti GIMN1.010]|uniref:Uncharacterized protein n=1 Tax=Corynebacterium deserti GIMN1.010 TaxID=931089 RepID=A0A0M3QAF5_9CORY|nr:hypothetical protein CDES_14575 [Corynebacterium deserti GIMN1.010]